MISELEAIFHKNGFYPESIETNSTWQRFKANANDSGKSGFYSLHEFQTSSGEIGYFGILGDWHDRSRDIKISTLKSIGGKDAKEAEKIFKKIERQREDAKIQIWEETSKITNEFWNTFAGGSATHPYLVRKKISELFGCKTQLAMSGPELLVPMRDVRGKFWSFQRILEDGQKFFYPGSKKKECFHLIGEFGPKVLICEGFATGASLHMATGLPVVVAFDSGNLEPVAKSLKQFYSESSFIICGDDDVFTKDNPGRTAAEKAAKACLGLAVFPKFKNLETKVTDFNDLHCLEGLERVREQVFPIEPAKVFIKPLGFRGSKFYYTSSENKQICSLDAHTETDLQKLIPFLEYWENNFPKQKGGINWPLARASLMENCLNQGIFREENIRGSGVWLDEGRVVVHLGNRLLVDGKEMELASFHSRYHYELEIELPFVHDEPLSKEECGRLRAICAQFNYAHIHQMIFLGGWIALSGICGALPWRPHLWLTGEAGSGKTTIKDFIDQILEWAFKRISVTGGTTEAGIRQRLRASAIPIIFDEFEPERKKSSDRVLDTLDLMRQASSLQKGEIIKGTQDQRGVSYQVSFMALVSSIKTSLLTEADRSRFTVIELVRGENNNSQWKTIQKAMNQIDAEFAERLFARMVQMIPIVIKNAKVAQDAFVSLGFSQRVGQQYGALVAGWQALESDHEWTLEEAISFCRNIDLGLEATVSTRSNPEECLEWLRHCAIRFENHEMTVETLLTNISDPAQWLEKTREKYGIYPRENNDVLIVKPNRELDKIFKADSQWTHAWFETLTRLQGARVIKTTISESKRKYVRGLLIPNHFFQ